jgi:UDPglucose--hexose-1-phosphate uridylyltransferase
MDSSYLLCDELTHDWIISAPGRARRPDGLRHRARDPFSPSALRQERVLAVYGKSPHEVTVVENRFPILHQDGEVRGRQEIFVEGNGRAPFSSFTAAQMKTTLDVMYERAKIFRADKAVKYLVAFKNEGATAGASQPHPHSQMFGLGFVPERAKQLLARSLMLRRKGKSIHRSVLAAATKELTIFSDKLVVAFAHPTGRLPYEVRIVTRRAIDNITETTSAERVSLARALHALMPLARARGFAYNFFFHDVFGEKSEMFEIRFTPRANVWGGFELDAGIFVNSVPADMAAEEYRKAKR